MRVPTTQRAERTRAEQRAIAALAIVCLVVSFGIVPNWLTDRRFFVVDGVYVAGPWKHDRADWESHSLWSFVSRDWPWAVAVATLHMIPLWYAWWRRSAMPVGGLIGVVLSLGTATALWLCIADVRSSLEETVAELRTGGYHPMLVASAVGFAVAFLVAPPPRDRSEPNALAVRRLVRRHRKETDADA